ncbi:MAG: PaaI family thioesterase [Microthrixaceae bacterium]
MGETDGPTPDPPLVTVSTLQEFMDTSFGGRVPWNITRLDRTTAELTLPTDEHDLRPGGSVSGPTMMMLADSGAYAAILAHIGLEPLAVTTNLSINFVRRAAPGVLVCDAKVLKAGRSLAVVEASLHDGEPVHKVAYAMVTYSLALLA